MAERFRVAVDVLVWILGRPPEDGSREALCVQEVSEDGAQVWLGLARVEREPGVVMTKYAAHHVPESNRDRALALRRMLTDAPPDLPDDMRLIGFAIAGDSELSYQSAPTSSGRSRSTAPIVVSRRFKQRPKRHR